MAPHQHVKRRPLLLAADAAHAAHCAGVLALTPDSWDYLADNATFSLHHADLQVIDCGGRLTPVQVALLDRLQVRLDDALLLTTDGALAPHPGRPTAHTG